MNKNEWLDELLAMAEQVEHTNNMHTRSYLKMNDFTRDLHDDIKVGVHVHCGKMIEIKPYNMGREVIIKNIVS